MAKGIKCTCGHSWNKSDSSKKDMYVCHMCGKDNTMKDGGWLNKFDQGGLVLKQKTKDNYGKKPNPNEVEASVGPDFVGLAYDTTGRNYSPAWGGQFQSGGRLPIITNDPKDPRLKAYNDSLKLSQTFPRWGDWADLNNNLVRLNGKAPTVVNTKEGLRGVRKPVQPVVYKKPEREPIIVNDPKDPKLKAYQDSLNLYNKTKDIQNPKYYTDGDPSWYNWKGNRKDAERFMRRNNIDLDYEYYRTNKFPGKIQPIKTGDFGEGMVYPIYKKPTQPVEYKKLEEIKPTQPTSKGSKKYIVNEMEVSEEDFLGSGATTGGGKRIIYNTPNKGTQKVLRLDGTPETDPDKIRRALATANKDEMAMGGSLPGSVGFTYARVAGSAPSNGKYAKKTKASAQNGKEMKFYQEGFDFKPNSIAQDGRAVKDKTMVKKPITTSSIVDSKKQTLQRYAREMAQREQPTLSNFDPLLNADARKQLYKEAEQNKLNNQLLKGADVATDLMQLGNFVPNPVGQLIGNIGNFAGGLIDSYQAYNAYDKEDYGDAAINLASVALPMQLGSSTFRRNSKYLQPGQPLNFLKGSKRVNYIEPFTNVRGMTNKSLMANRALLGTLGAETAYDSYQDGGAIVDPMGQWAHPGEVTIIPDTNITMEGVDYPVLGISDTGDQQMMYPGEDYDFDGEYVTEYPMMKKGGWLSKYQDGGGLLMNRFKEENAPSDATRVSAPIKPLTKKEQKENVRINKQTQKNTEEYNKAVIADRKSKRETKGDVNVPGSFNIAEKARLFPESVGGVGEIIDEYLNPGTIVGTLADSLGESIAARSPEGVAATLAMTAGAGALGFDPLSTMIKPAKLLDKYLTEKIASKSSSKFSGVDNLNTFTQNKLKDWIEKNVEELVIEPEPKPDFGSMTIDKIESENYLKNYQKNLQSNYNKYLKDKQEAAELWNEEVNILGKDPKDVSPMYRDLVNDPNFKNFYVDLEPTNTKHIAKGLTGDYAGTDINTNLVDKDYLPKGGRALITKDSGEGFFRKSADNFGDYKQVKPWEVFDKNFFIRKNKNGGWLDKYK
jgi:hypothetical protein